MSMKKNHRQCLNYYRTHVRGNQMTIVQVLMEKFGLVGSVGFLGIIILLALIDTAFAQTIAAGFAVVLAASGIYLLARSNDGNIAMAEDQKRALVALASQTRVLYDKLSELEGNKRTLPPKEFREFFLAQRNALLAYDRETLTCLYALKAQQQAEGKSHEPNSYDLFLALERNLSTLSSESTLLHAKNGSIITAHQQLLTDAHQFLIAIAQLDSHSLQTAYQNMQRSNQFLKLISDDLPAMPISPEPPSPPKQQTELGTPTAPVIEKTQIPSFLAEARAAFEKFSFNQLSALIPLYQTPNDTELMQLVQAKPLIMHQLSSVSDYNLDKIADLLYEEFNYLSQGSPIQKEKIESIVANFMFDPAPQSTLDPTLGTIWALLCFGENNPRLSDYDIQEHLRKEKEYWQLMRVVDQHTKSTKKEAEESKEDEIAQKLQQSEAFLRSRQNNQQKLLDIYFSIASIFLSLDTYINYALSKADIKEALGQMP